MLACLAAMTKVASRQVSQAKDLESNTLIEAKDLNLSYISSTGQLLIMINCNSQ